MPSLSRRQAGSPTMRKRLLCGLIVIFGTGANGQWLNYPTPGTPRTKDGKPNLTAPAPRAAGKPDLSGLWQPEPAQPGENHGLFESLGAFVVPGDDPTTFSKYFFSVLADFKPAESPLRAAAAELVRKRGEALGRDNPTSHCLPMGLPGLHLIPSPYKIVQTPSLVMFLYETVNNTFRQVYTDGRKLPADFQPAWMGYSVGKWEGDTLVIESAGFNDKVWLDGFGTPSSETLHLQERFRRLDFGHMELQVTIDDPKTFTKPFSFKLNQRLVPDSDVLETVCAENERDVPHLGR